MGWGSPSSLGKLDVTEWSRDVARPISQSLCVCLSVGRSGMYTAAKRLIGSGCRLGWSVGSVEGGVY